MLPMRCACKVWPCAVGAWCRTFCGHTVDGDFSTRQCGWESYWMQREVEAGLKEQEGEMLEHYVKNYKKARRMAKYIYESQARHPEKFRHDKFEPVWKKIDQQDDALIRMYALVGDLPRTEDNTDTRDRTAEVAEARCGKMKVDEGRSMVSQLLASSPGGETVTDDIVMVDVPVLAVDIPTPAVDVAAPAVDVAAPMVHAPGPVYRHHMLDDDDNDDELWFQVAEEAEVEYARSKASKDSDNDDELWSQVADEADLIEAEYIRTKAASSKASSASSSSDEDLLPDYVSDY